MDLGWASKKRGRGEAEDGGSTQTDESSGDDCDDEDGCEASGEESGEWCTKTYKQACGKGGINNGKHTPTHALICRPRLTSSILVQIPYNSNCLFTHT